MILLVKEDTMLRKKLFGIGLSCAVVIGVNGGDICR